MAIDPMDKVQLSAGPPAGVSHLGLVPEADVPDPVAEELDALRARLQTERSAGRALLAAITELERRLVGERSTSQALLTTVRGLDDELATARADLASERGANGELWSQINDLNAALIYAERPLWRKLLGRS